MAIKKLTANVSIGTNLVDSVNGLIDSSAPSSAGLLTAKLSNNSADANILIVSDSTGDAVDEWPYLMAVQLASMHPQFTVNFRYWDNTGDADYGSATEIQSGTGSKSLTIYCAAKAGSKPDYFMGGRIDNAVIAIPQCDLIILNHGHNIAEDITEQLYPMNQMLECIFTIMRYHEGAGLVISSQNPKRDSDFYETMYSGLVTVAGLCHADITDSYSKFIEAGKPSAYYTDNTHPSALGNMEIMLPSIMRMFKNNYHKSARNPLHDSSKNYLVNGDFSDFGGAIPSSWSATNATCSQNVTEFESVNGYSVQVSQVSAAAGSISQSVNVDHLPRLRGGWVTLLARVYVDSSQPDTAGRVIIGSNGVSGNYPVSTGGRDGWVWKTVSIKVPDDATFLKTTIYASSNSDTGIASFDRVAIISGRIMQEFD